MLQWMSLLWLLWIAMFITKQETSGFKSCGSHIKMIWSQNISWGQLRSLNFIGPACWNYSKMVWIWAILDPRKHHSNAICNMRGVGKMSPQGVGEGNHLFKKSYEGLVGRLKGVTWKTLDNDKISGKFIPPPPFLHYSFKVQFITATNKRLWKSLREMMQWMDERAEGWRGFSTKIFVCVGAFGSSFLCLSQLEACGSLSSCRLIPKSCGSQWESKDNIFLIECGGRQVAL